jgi:hypothetical protein
MGGKYGTKNTKELLSLISAVGVAIVVASKKDGWQLSDLLAFLKSPEVDAALASAIADIAVIPAEVVELDVFDGIDLGRHAYACMDKVVDALRAS